MTGLPTGHSGRRQVQADRRPVQVPPPEVFVEDEQLVVALHLPWVRIQELRYEVRPRSMTVWRAGAGLPFRHDVSWDPPVDPTCFFIQECNGVVEFRIALEGAPRKDTPRPT